MAFFLPDAAYSLPQALPQQPQEPFLWSGGGQRVSADDIARQRVMAEQQLGAGMDYSPVQSPWQGLARVAQGITGALAMKKADKEAAANQSASDAITQALLSGNGSSGDAVTAALLDPNASPQARQLATMQWKLAHPTPHQPTGDEALLTAAGLVPGTPEYQATAGKLLDRKNDPFITTSLPGGGFYAGPQSDFMSALTGGGGPASANPGAATPPATLPSDFDFGGPTPNASGSFP